MTLIVSAGVVGACQIGKLAIAAPLLQENLGLSLLMLAWIAGAYAAIGVVGGLLAGFLVSHFPLRKVVVAGLVLIAIGNFAGAMSHGSGLLIASRIVEGIGFLAMVVSCPPLLRGVVSARHQQMIFACWSAYMPVGTLLMLLAGPFIMRDNWQWLWVFNGGLAAFNAAAFSAIPPAKPSVLLKALRPQMSDVLAIVTSPAPLVLAVCFALYATQYFALATFLPILVVERLDFSLSAAGFFSATALAANAAGNIGAGVLLRLGMPIPFTIMLVFAVVAVAGPVVFTASLPAILVAFAACLCLGLSGMLPSTIISSMPRFASGSQRLAIGMGLIQQASATAQVAGPVALAFCVEWQGWPGVAYMFGLIGACGLTSAVLLHCFTRNSHLPDDAT